MNMTPICLSLKPQHPQYHKNMLLLTLPKWIFHEGTNTWMDLLGSVIEIFWNLSYLIFIKLEVLFFSFSRKLWLRAIIDFDRGDALSGGTSSTDFSYFYLYTIQSVKPIFRTVSLHLVTSLPFSPSNLYP